MTCQGDADRAAKGAARKLYERAVRILRWLVPLALVVYLIDDIRRQEGFEQIWSGDKDWNLLGLALLFFLGAQVLTIGRWYWLVRALNLPFRWNDAVRLGFLGYLLTFVSLGAVGGDLLKALFIAREQPGRRVEAFATVIVDRILGLYALMLLAAGAIIASGLWQSTATAVHLLCQAVLCTTALATLGLMLLLALGSGREMYARPFLNLVCRMPKLAARLKPLGSALSAYRRDRKTVATSIVVGLISQSLLAACIWAIAAALLPEPPGIAQHLVIVPLALLTTMLPLPGYGLGAFEVALEFLYRHVGLASAGSGLLVAVAFRAVMVATALISAIIYAANRRELTDVLTHAEADREPIGCHS
jgi:glycosyltransferase 2 family protein